MAQINKKWLKGVGQANGLASLDADGKIFSAQLPESVTGEAALREQADDALSGRLDALEADPTTKTYVDGEIVAAKAYADQKVTDLKDGVDAGYDTLKKIQTKIEFITSNADGEALDSLSEIVTAFQQADSTINGAITSLANSAAADVDAEESARIAADAVLQAAIDQEVIDRAAGDVAAVDEAKAYADAAISTALEGFVPATWYKKKVVLSATDISNGYIDLDHEAIASSIGAFANRIAIHFFDDYTVSVVGGKTRLTFAGEVAVGGVSQLEVSDVIRVKYQY